MNLFRLICITSLLSLWMVSDGMAGKRGRNHVDQLGHLIDLVRFRLALGPSSEKPIENQAGMLSRVLQAYKSVLGPIQPNSKFQQQQANKYTAAKRMLDDYTATVFSLRQANWEESNKEKSSQALPKWPDQKTIERMTNLVGVVGLATWISKVFLQDTVPSGIVPYELSWLLVVPIVYPTARRGLSWLADKQIDRSLQDLRKDPLLRELLDGV